jgi:hypothetical protein
MPHGNSGENGRCFAPEVMTDDFDKTGLTPDAKRPTTKGLVSEAEPIFATAILPAKIDEFGNSRIVESVNQDIHPFSQLTIQLFLEKRKDRIKLDGLFFINLKRSERIGTRQRWYQHCTAEFGIGGIWSRRFSVRHRMTETQPGPKLVRQSRQHFE